MNNDKYYHIKAWLHKHHLVIDPHYPEIGNYVLHKNVRFVTENEIVNIKNKYDGLDHRIEMQLEPESLPESDIYNFISQKLFFFDSKYKGNYKITHCKYCDEQTRNYMVTESGKLLYIYCENCRRGHIQRIKSPILPIIRKAIAKSK